MERKFDKKIIGFVKKKKIVTMKEIRAEIDVSKPTIWRALIKEEYLTSCTNNAIYYTLMATPVFDENGLWKHKGVLFSRSGTLKETILDKVNNSEAGITSSQLEKLLCRGSRNVLSTLHLQKKVISTMVGGERFYFSAEKEKRTEQVFNASKLHDEQCKEEEKIRHEIVLSVIAQFIETPKLPVKRIYNRLRRLGINVSQEEVRMITETYDLGTLKKKQ